MSLVTVPATANETSFTDTPRGEMYEMPDISGFPADIAKDYLKDDGFKPKFKTTDGRRGKAKTNWLVVSTKPAAGELIRKGKKKPKITVIVRKEDVTATGITGEQAAAACEAHADAEFHYGAKIKGKWRASATDDVSTIKARLEVGNTFGKEVRMICDVSKSANGDLTVDQFETIGIDR